MVVRRSCPSDTGKSTLFANLKTMSAKGNSILVPKNCKRRAGVAKIPSKFPSAALHRAVATEPFDAEVKKIHILTVVGKHVNISRPSRSGWGSNASHPINVGIIFPKI